MRRPGIIGRMENVDGKVETSANDCPIAPESQVSVYTRVLHRACQIVGGVERLARRLRVPVPTLFRWLDGDGEPPTPVFLKAVDIVMPAWSEDDDAFARALRAGRPKELGDC